MNQEEEIMRLRDGHDFLAESLHKLSLAQTETQGAVRETSNSVKDLVESLDRRWDGLDKRFAPLSRFEIIEKVVFGATALILIAVVGTWLSLVVVKP